MQIIKNGPALHTIDDWRAHAPPRTPEQWTRGRSAFECAAAWFSSSGPCVPPEIAGLLASHEDTASAQITGATPGHPVRFDRGRGEPRTCDVVAVAESGDGLLAICIDAKVDETFDGSVEQALADAVDRRAHGQRSNNISRIEQLAAALLPPPRRGVPPLGALRAVLIVHEFVSERTEERRRASDYANLSGFVARLSDGHAAVEPGVLHGPFGVPGAPLFERPAALYVGKAVRRWRPSA